jgi:hypothetical protein
MEGHRKRQGGSQGPNGSVERKWESSELRSVWQRHPVSCSEQLKRHEHAAEFTLNVCPTKHKYGLLLTIHHFDPARLVE